MKSIHVLIAALVTLLLVGCGGHDGHADLKRKMDEIRAKPRGAVSPPPEPIQAMLYSYSAHKLRSPFQRPVEEVVNVNIIEGRQVTPDLARPTEYLEKFTFDSLRMAGTTQWSDGLLYAIVSDPEGQSHFVKKGDFMGKNHGRIDSVVASKITVIEIVPDGHDGWVERPRVMRMLDN